MTYSFEELDEMYVLTCQDCGFAYGHKDWIDVVVPNDQWELLTGKSDGSGILCAGCMARRAARLKDKNGAPLFSAGILVFE